MTRDRLYTVATVAFLAGISVEIVIGVMVVFLRG